MESCVVTRRFPPCRITGGRTYNIILSWKCRDSILPDVVEQNRQNMQNLPKNTFHDPFPTLKWVNKLPNEIHPIPISEPSHTTNNQLVMDTIMLDQCSSMGQIFCSSMIVSITIPNPAWLLNKPHDVLPITQARQIPATTQQKKKTAKHITKRVEVTA